MDLAIVSASSVPKKSRRISERIADDARRMVWRRAAKHALGAGLETGTPALKPAADARRWCLQHKRYDAARAVEAAVRGAIWNTDSSCTTCRCGQLDSPAHRYFECPLLKEMDDECIASSQWLARE